MNRKKSLVLMLSLCVIALISVKFVMNDYHIDKVVSAYNNHKDIFMDVVNCLSDYEELDVTIYEDIRVMIEYNEIEINDEFREKLKILKEISNCNAVEKKNNYVLFGLGNSEKDKLIVVLYDPSSKYIKENKYDYREIDNHWYVFEMGMYLT